MTEETTKVFQGHIGTWSKLEEVELNGKLYELWESEIFGDDANGIITEDGEMIIEDSFNGLAVDLGDHLDLPYEYIAAKVVD